MDTKDMRDRIKQKAAETGVMKDAPGNRVHKRRVRSYKSLIINLIALIGLFALVFVLQQVGTRHSEKTATTESATQITEVTATEVTVEEPLPVEALPVPVEEKIQNQEVAMVEMETTREGAAQPKAQAKIILKTKKTKKIKTATKPRKTVKRRTQSWQEDRRRSAALVDMLDVVNAKNNTSKSAQTYMMTNPRQQPTYTAPRRSYSGRVDRRSSAELVDMLDGGGTQNNKPRTKRINWANEVPMASTQPRAYATAAPQEKPTYVAPSRRPAWDVNSGEGR